VADNISILNTIWTNASTNYQDRIPQATRDNIQAVGNAILNYAAAKNEFLDALVNKIALQLVSSKMAKNKLAEFKQGKIEYGSDIEEIFTNIAQAQSFDVPKAEAEVFKRKQPDVRAMFHRVNRQDVYKVTIEEGQIKRAFYSSDGLGKVVASIINSLYSGDNYDEYVLMKQLIADYWTNVNQAKVIQTPQVTDKDSALEFFRSVRQASLDFTFMSNHYNPQGVLQSSAPEEQVLLLHKNASTFLDTDLLAWVFNRENIEMQSKVVILDDFGTLANTQAALVDKRWFMVFDNLFETRNLYNPEGMYYNYWLHHHQTLSTSQFHNAIAFQIPVAP
jgi:hypothetical protein